MDKFNRLTRHDEWEVGARYRFTMGRPRARRPHEPPLREVTFLGWADNGRLVGCAVLQEADGTKGVHLPNVWRNRWVLVDTPAGDGLPPIEDAADMFAAPAATPLAQLKGRQPSGMVVINAENNTATLHYAYPYEIDLDTIRTERDLLAWSLHLCQKNWIDTERLHEVVTAIAKHKAFELHRR